MANQSVIFIILICSRHGTVHWFNGKWNGLAVSSDILYYLWNSLIINLVKVSLKSAHTVIHPHYLCLTEIGHLVKDESEHKFVITGLLAATSLSYVLFNRIL